MATAKRKSKTKSSLDTYRGKRDFERTAEPAGEADASEAGRLYVVQRHAARQLHYDFRLELDGVLKSWAVPRGPSLDPKQRPLAVHVEDHPIEYGSFEGVIPKGEYGGGTVMLWDQGRWEPIGDAAEGYARGDLKFRLHGEKLRGAWVLARMGGKAGDDGKNWLLIKKKDDETRPVQSFNILAEAPFSVLSGRSMQEITTDPEAVWKDGRAVPSGPTGGGTTTRGAGAAPDPAALPAARRGTAPATLKPNLATRVDDAPPGDDWLHEIKLDGYRMMCRITGGEPRLFTRNGHDWTERMPGVAKAASRLPVKDVVLDGEVVILDAKGISDFQALQNAFRGGTGATFVYYVFDVLFSSGYDLRRVPLIDRKAYLEALLRVAPLAAPTIRYCDHIVGGGPVVFKQAAESGLEGIVSKRAASAYESRRTDSWLKVKTIRRQEFVIGGFTRASKGRSGFGALLLGHHDASGRLVYCGRVGTGFSDDTLASVHGELAKRLRSTPPFVNPDADPEPRVVHWVEPQLVAEVTFGAWTDEGNLRHASFKGLREDIDAADVVREAPSGSRFRGAVAPPKKTGRVANVTNLIMSPASPSDASVAGVRISNPKRSVYPESGVTKLDVARYYEQVAQRMLPHVAKRPLSLVRCPLGLAGESFYQRELGEGFPDAIRGLTIGRGKGQDHAIAINDVAGLVSLAQMGVLEIHSWGCREDNLDKPDHLVFDLDPGSGILWEHIIAGAKFVRDRLGNVGLTSFVKTSGGKGLHVVVPLTRRTGWEEAKAFAKAVADDIVRVAPMNFVATMAKSQRDNRIFIDYLRNQKGATSVAPYSTRARPGATVSTPLRWDELSVDETPADHTVVTVPGRLAQLGHDPWDGFHEMRQSITAAMRRDVGLRR